MVSKIYFGTVFGHHNVINTVTKYIWSTVEKHGDRFVDHMYVVSTMYFGDQMYVANEHVLVKSLWPNTFGQ